LLARLVDNKYIHFEQITPHEEEILDVEFRVRHPNYQYIDASFGLFDGWYHKYNRRHRRMARPFLEDLKAACKKRGMPLMIQDDRPEPEYPAPSKDIVTPDLLHGITLDDHQIRAIKSACDNEVGIISCPTGGGKTESMAGITKIMNCPTIILCDMTVIVDQIKERLELRDVDDEIGMFYSGKRPNGQRVVVGSFQSLLAPKPNRTENDIPESYAKKMAAYKTRVKNARKLREMIAKCDLLLVDECDSATSQSWRKLFWHWFKGRRRYGVSGTPFDPDKPVQNMLLREHLGSVICTVSRTELEKIGRIIPVTYTAMAFGDPDLIKDKSAYDIAVREHMIESEAFHKLIQGLAHLTTSKNPYHGTLILVESKQLGYRLEEIVPHSKFICGDHSMKDRKAAIKAFEDREARVLIGGKIIKRGLDLRGGCENLILATGGKLASDFNQKVGRAVRSNATGRAKIWDVFFLCNHYLYAHSRKRLKTIVAMGYDAKVVFKSAVIEANKFIRSRFRRPK